MIKWSVIIVKDDKRREIEYLMARKAIDEGKRLKETILSVEKSIV